MCMYVWRKDRKMRNENIFSGKQKAPGVKFWLLAFITLWLRSVLKPLSASVSPVSAINLQYQLTVTMTMAWENEWQGPSTVPGYLLRIFNQMIRVDTFILAKLLLYFLILLVRQLSTGVRALKTNARKCFPRDPLFFAQMTLSTDQLWPTLIAQLPKVEAFFKWVLPMSGQCLQSLTLRRVLDKKHIYLRLVSRTWPVRVVDLLLYYMRWLILGPLNCHSPSFIWGFKR